MGAKTELEPRFEDIIPPGEDRLRAVCGHCGFINYENPKIVVGSIASWEDKIVLCRRAIEPRLGFWTIPAGYMELNETPEDGAVREAMEEATAQLLIDRLLAIYSIPRISQVQLIFRASLVSPDIAPGPESQDVRLCAWEDIPWADLAFPSVGWALRQWRESRTLADFAPYGNPTEGL